MPPGGVRSRVHAQFVDGLRGPILPPCSVGEFSRTGRLLRPPDLPHVERSEPLVNRKRQFAIAATVVLLVLCLSGMAAAYWAVHHIPGVGRLVYGEPPTFTPLPTLRPTFDLSTATLTPLAPSPSLTSTPLPLPTATPPTPPTSTSTADLSPLPTPEPTASPSVPMPTFTPHPPTPTPIPPTPTPRPPQWLAFETERGKLGDYEIFVMTTTGERVTNVTNSWADDVAPVWSPNGRRIAFVSLRDTPTGKWGLGPGSIYLLDFDPIAGRPGKVVRLTDGGGDDNWPTWSPDGKKIAFMSDRSGNWDIWIINVDGSGLTQVTHHPGEDEFPDWSPDGKKIAFTSKRGGNRDIWVMNVDGSNPVNLTNMPGRDRYPMWSPDGKMIAFNTKRDGNQEIYVMNADGSNQRNVTNAPDSTEGLADWSPDGKRLVLYSNKPGNKDIFILDLATGHWTNVHSHPASDEFCTWSP